MKKPVNAVTVAIEGIGECTTNLGGNQFPAPTGLQTAFRGTAFPHGTAVDISLM